MTKTVQVPNAKALEGVREKIYAAMTAFVQDEEMGAELSGFEMSGAYLYIPERNEYWFAVTWIWVDHYPTEYWGTIFPQLAEFDAMTGSPDPKDSFGFRQAETLEQAYRGEYE